MTHSDAALQRQAREPLSRRIHVHDPLHSRSRLTAETAEHAENTTANHESHETHVNRCHAAFMSTRNHHRDTETQRHREKTRYTTRAKQADKSAQSLFGARRTLVARLCAS